MNSPNRQPGPRMGHTGRAGRLSPIAEVVFRSLILLGLGLTVSCAAAGRRSTSDAGSNQNQCTPVCWQVDCGQPDGCGATCEFGSGCACTPACSGKPCGEPDGCGTLCWPGSGCDCTPDCTGKPCGFADGCAGTCSHGNSDCICSADCADKICGVDDGCGNVCQPGSGCCDPSCDGIPCGQINACNNPCTPPDCCDNDCSGVVCGQTNACNTTCQPGSGCCDPLATCTTSALCGSSDGCGSTCQLPNCCDPLATCNATVPCGTANGCGGTCQLPDCCQRNCNGVTCGNSDGCGGTCVAPADPCTCNSSCTGKICGADDGCGTTCAPGSGCCDPMATCNSTVVCGTADGCGGTCQPPNCCQPQCGASVLCGTADGCGGTCQAPNCCTPSCSGKVCGASDGCGGTCEYGGGCYVACTPWDPGDPDGVIYTNVGFEGSLGSMVADQGTVTAVGAEGGVSPYAGSGMLHVDNGGSGSGVARYSRSSMSTGVITVFFYDDGTSTDTSLWVTVTDGLNASAYNASTNPNGQRNSVAILYRPTGGTVPPASRSHYLLRTDVNYTGAEQTYYDTQISRSAGWHQVEIFVTPEGAWARLDGRSLISLHTNTSLTGFRSVFLATSDGTGAMHFDKLTVTSLPDLEAQEFALLDQYVDIYGATDYSSLLPCSCNRGANARLPILHLALGNWLRYRNLCPSASSTTYLDQAVDQLEDFMSTYSCWQTSAGSAAFASLAALAGWLLWDALPGTLKTDIHDMVVAEANYFSTGTGCTSEQYVHCPYVSYNLNPANSEAQTNAWTAGFYALAARMFAGDADASTWDQRARAAGFHTFTTGDSYGGYTTHTINGADGAADYWLVSDHGLTPCSYVTGGTLQLLDSAILPYALTGGTAPSQLRHNFAYVLTQYFGTQVDFSDYETFVNPDTTSWGMDGAWLFPLAHAAVVASDNLYVLWERDLVDYKARNSGDFLYDTTTSTVATLACSDTSAGNAVDVARRNGRVQWYWLQGSLLWHMSPSLSAVTVP